MNQTVIVDREARLSMGSALRTLMAVPRMAISFLIDTDRRPLPLNDDLKARVRAEQVDLSLRLAPFTVITAFAVVQVVTYLFWGSGNERYLVLLESSVVALSALAIERCWRWRSNPKLVEVERRFVQTFVFVALVSGMLLGSIPLVLFVDADAQRRLLIACTCAGLIATGISIAVVPRAAISFSGPIILGSFVALAMTGDPFYLFVAILLSVYASFIFMTMLHLSRLVTMRVTTQADLERQQELTNLLLNDFEENASDWLWETDADLRLQHISARLIEVTRSTGRKLQGMPLERLVLLPIKRDNAHPAGLLWTFIAERQTFHSFLLPLQIAGETRWWSLSGKPIFDNSGAFMGYRGVGSDVTLRKLSEERLSHLATHDALTDLPNRMLFQDHLDQVRREAGGKGFAVLCLDLDEFKSVNDTFGHAVGDTLLRSVAERLRRFSAPDVLVARLAGDEFAILLSGQDRPVVGNFAAQIVAAVAAPYHFGEIRVSVGVSIGIAIAPQNGSEDLMRRADLALYRMKGEGRNGFRFYEAEMDERIEARRTLTGDLRKALDRNEFILHFQPLVSAQTSAIQGFEALLRWQHPTRGLIPPAEFIPLCEQTGVIIPLGEWALREACRIAATWPSSLSVAVNLSSIQFRHSDVLSVVREALRESGLSAHRLELEITESVFLEATSAIHAVLQTLRGMKVRLSLDDFGTGYSSLSSLRRMPFDKIKIDQSFVHDLPHEEGDVAIIRAIVELAKSLGMTITAEGVETEEQRLCLLQQGCHQFQGYLFSPPVPAEIIAGLLATPRLRAVSPHAALTEAALRSA